MQIIKKLKSLFGRARRQPPTVKTPYRDIPLDILSIILFYISQESDPSTKRKSLHSCLLVNRTWCAIVIPMCWSDPFSIIQSVYAIDTYLNFLSRKERRGLTMSGIVLPERQKSKLFDYPTYLKELKLSQLWNAADDWWIMKSRTRFRIDKQKRILTKTLAKLFLGPRSRIRCLTIDSSILIKSDFVDLRSTLTQLNQAVNQLCIDKVFDWSMFSAIQNSPAVESITTLDLGEYVFMSDTPNISITDQLLLVELISSIRKLRRIRIYGHGTMPTEVLRSLGKHANNLKSITLEYMDFNLLGDSNAMQAIEACGLLEELEIINCLNATGQQLAPLIDVRFPHMHTLQIITSTSAFETLFISLASTNSATLRNLAFHPADNYVPSPLRPTSIEVISTLPQTFGKLGIPFNPTDMSLLRKLLSCPEFAIEELNLFSWKRNPERWHRLDIDLPECLKLIRIYTIGGSRVNDFENSLGGRRNNLRLEWIYLPR
ncbi:6140_t:CDS:1 [Paraglomus brasilianum]|uniref:6140_t:CDS:1 n=1 Tax=Paraglomus brasilianum TaxID=144538 RepID=A0A9N9GI67_9GLOM|nr:6140_t:CDS:1 [Paraglomus brasilianum]